jgi:crossover junction endodeoxyribonuclease RuvC
MKLIGIDTALRCTGYGVIEVQGKDIVALDCGVIKNSRTDSHSNCLRRISGGVRELVRSFEPDIASIEGGFYMKNAKTAMVLGMARGTVISILAEHDVPIYEYAPRKTKQVVVGSGGASKEQVATYMKQMLHLADDAIPDDATDALSLAVCHALLMQTANGIHLPESI